jgi:gliding motility-associated-like protein
LFMRNYCTACFFILVAVSTFAQPTSNLVAHYKFNGTAVDGTSNGNNGQVKGTFSYVPDRFGNCGAAIKLGGVTAPGYVKINNSNSLKFNTLKQFSFSVWVRLDSWTGLDGNGNINPSGVHQVFCKGGDGIATAPGFYSALSQSNGNMIFGASNTGTNMSVSGNVSSAYIPGSWIHLAYTAGNGVERIYANGTLVSTHNAVLNFSTTDNQDIFLGIMGNQTANGNPVWYPLNGTLDDVRIYSRTLTATEVTQLFNESNASSNPGVNATSCGLLAHYKLDNNALDGSGNGNNGTFLGSVTATQDRFGNCNKAMKFNGTTGYMQIGNSVSLSSPAKAITLSAWARIDNSNDPDLLASMICKVGPGDLDLHYRFGVGSDRKLFIGFTNTGASTNFDFRSSSTISASVNLNAWHLYSVTYDGSVIRFYFDGTLLGVTQSSTALMKNFNATLNLGRDQHGNDEYVSADLDDIRIYNRALTAAEITQFYNAAPDYPAPSADINCGLIGYYKFDNNAQDASVYANHGTANSGVTFIKDRMGNCQRAASFNGTSGYISAPSSASLNSPSSMFSISYWIYIKNWFSTGGSGFCQKGNQSSIQYEFYQGSTNITLNGGSRNYNLIPGVWYHITAVQNDNTGTFYVNGNPIGSSNILLSYLSNISTAPFEIGRHIYGNTEYHNGALDDLRLYNRALSAAEVAQIYALPPSSPNPVPAASISAPQTTICAGQTVTLTANSNTGSITYQWIKDNVNIPSAISSTYTATTTGVYRVRITKTAGCDSLSLPVNITVNTLPTVTLQGPVNQSGCGSVALVATATAGVQYLWKRNGVNISGANAASYTATQNGAYVVVVTTAAGCTASSAAINVTINTAPSATAYASTPCAGQILNLALSTTGQMFSWAGPAGFSSSAQNPVLNNSQLNMSGIYTVTVTNTTGCTVTSSVSVTILPSPTPIATASPTAVCLGGSLMLNASGGATYSWNNGLGTGEAKTVTPSSSATYTVTVTNIQGCSAIATVAVQVYPVPVANAGPDQEICQHQSAVLNASGGTGYVWNTGAQTQQIQVSPLSNTSYFVTVSNSYLCTTVDTVNVIVHTQPNGTFIANKPFYCEGEDAILSVGGGQSYFWTYPNGSTFGPSVQPVNTVSNLQLPSDAGVYSVVVEDGNTCRDTNFLVIDILPSPNVAIIGDSIICFEESTVFTLETDGSSFIWSNGDDLNPTLVLFPSTTGTDTYSVTVTGANGCTQSATKKLTTNPRPNIDIKGDERPICIGSDTLLTATGSGANTYLWSTGQNTISIVVAPSQTTQYQLVGNNQYGCPDTAKATVLVRKPPEAHQTQVNIACLEEQLISGVLPEGGIGEWISLNGAVVENQDSATTQVLDLNLGNNLFLWKVKNPPCPDIIVDSVILKLANQHPNAVADDTLIIQSGALSLNVAANDSLSHLPGGFNTTLTAFDENGQWDISPNGILEFEPDASFIGVASANYLVCNQLCPTYCSEAKVIVLVRQPDEDIGKTIVITPDGNNKNDVLVFDYLNLYKDNSLLVFNRWGQQVYYANPYQNDWSGVFNGKPLPAGTYYYILNFENNDERVWGNLLILR